MNATSDDQLLDEMIAGLSSNANNISSSTTFPSIHPNGHNTTAQLMPCESSKLLNTQSNSSCTVSSSNEPTVTLTLTPDGTINFPFAPLSLSSSTSSKCTSSSSIGKLNGQTPIFSFKPASTEYDQHMQQLGYGHHAMHGLAQIPMLSSTGLNLTVMAPTGLTQGGQHHLGQLHGQHQIMYQSPAVQQQQNVTHLTHHQAQQQQQQQVQQNHHGNHQMQGHQMAGHGGQGGGGHHGGGHGGQHAAPHGKGMKKKPKINKDGVPAPKRATTAYINFTQWYREELKKSGRAIPKVSPFGVSCIDPLSPFTLFPLSIDR